MAVFNIHTLNF